MSEIVEKARAAYNATECNDTCGGYLDHGACACMEAAIAAAETSRAIRVLDLEAHLLRASTRLMWASARMGNGDQAIQVQEWAEEARLALSPPTNEEDR